MLALSTVAFCALALVPARAESPLSCKHTIDNREKVGEGSSLRLEYNVDGVKAFNGFWMKLGGQDRGNNFDASGFQKLTLRIKGDKNAGIPAMVRVEMKGDEGDVIGHYYVRNISPDWTRVEIPLEIYTTQGVQLAALNELTIGFENKAALPGAVKGAVWIDDIVLEGDGSPRILADFNNPDMNNLGGKWGTYTP
jgi:hypothetical protein